MRFLVLIGLMLVAASLVSMQMIRAEPVYLGGGSTGGPPPAGFHGYVYLFKNDLLDFKYRFEGGSEWSISIIVERVSTGEKWFFNDTGFISNPITPVFRAPYTGLYYVSFIINGIKPPRTTYSLSIQPSGIESRYEYWLPRLLLLIVIGLLLIMMGFWIDTKWPLGLVMVSREIQDLWKDYIMVIFMCIMLYTRSFPYTMLYNWPVFLEKQGLIFKEVYLASTLYDSCFHQLGRLRGLYGITIYMLHSSIMGVALFSYCVEKKIFRDMIIAGISRTRLYLSKASSLFILLILPLVIPHTALMLLADTNLFVSKPLVILYAVSIRFLIDSTIALTMFSIVFAPALVIPRTFLALATILVLPYTLSMMIDCITISNLNTLLYETLYGFKMSSLILPMSLIAFVIVIVLGLIFVRVKDYA
ncbi:MAG: hypothetical protein J7K21_04060 [Desulfurococcales archaeon]|nr:hypothetical protein [Desulfurococcales archaeon]